MAGMRLILAVVEEDLVAGGSSSARQPDLRMKPSIWKRMNSELLEEVLLFLPSSSQARFRCVCKRWNKLMTSPAFLKQTWWVALARTGGDALCILEQLDETDFKPIKKFPPQLKVQELDVPPEAAALTLSHRGGGDIDRAAFLDSIKLGTHMLHYHVLGGIVAMSLQTEYGKGIHRFLEWRVWVLDLASDCWTWREVPGLRVPWYMGIWTFLLADVTRSRPLQRRDNVELSSGCDFELQYVMAESNTGKWTNCKIYSCTYSAVGWQEGKVKAPPEPKASRCTCACPQRKVFCYVFRTAGYISCQCKERRNVDAGQAVSDPETRSRTYFSLRTRPLKSRDGSWVDPGLNFWLRFPFTGSEDSEFRIDLMKFLRLAADGHGDSPLPQTGTVYAKSFSGSNSEGRGLTWQVEGARLVGYTALLVIQVTINATNLEASSSSRHALAYHVPSATSRWLAPVTGV